MLEEYSKSEVSRLRTAYRNHRMDAARREIEFQLTFEEWFNIWHQSGKLLKRGCHRGQYVMARRGDQGPYAKENVKIIKAEDNHKERRVKRDAQGNYVGTSRREEVRAGRGVQWGPEHRGAISRAMKGNTNSKGVKRSEETKRKMREAHKRRSQNQ